MIDSSDELEFWGSSFFCWWIERKEKQILLL
jgi:hypothetical protein